MLSGTNQDFFTASSPLAESLSECISGPHIGGYQVCEKWLKDRKGRELSINDFYHYQHIVAALAETITRMEQIDEAINKHGGWPLT